MCVGSAVLQPSERGVNVLPQRATGEGCIGLGPPPCVKYPRSTVRTVVLTAPRASSAKLPCNDSPRRG